MSSQPGADWRDVKHISLRPPGISTDGRPAVNVALTGGNYVAGTPVTSNNAGFLFHNWYVSAWSRRRLP